MSHGADAAGRWSQPAGVAGRTGVHLDAIRALAAKWSTRPPALRLATSSCALRRGRSSNRGADRLGATRWRSSRGVVDRHGLTHRYNSVKRFVRALEGREPVRFRLLEFLPSKEA